VLRKNPGFDAPTGFETVHTTADSRQQSRQRHKTHTKNMCIPYIYHIYYYILIKIILII
jgi:hypothetical protein